MCRSRRREVRAPSDAPAYLWVLFLFGACVEKELPLSTPLMKKCKNRRALVEARAARECSARALTAARCELQETTEAKLDATHQLLQVLLNSDEERRAALKEVVESAATPHLRLVRRLSQRGPRHNKPRADPASRRQTLTRHPENELILVDTPQP